MVAAVWSVFLRGAVLENHEEIPARTSTIRDCVDPRLSAALPFMTTIDQRSAVKQKANVPAARRSRQICRKGATICLCISRVKSLEQLICTCTGAKHATSPKFGK